MKLFSATKFAAAAGVIMLAVGGSAFADTVKTITGAGSTFAYPLYSKWASAYSKENGFGLNYQSIGSGGGIRQVEAGTVVFGGSDAPLKSDELAKYGLIQFPTAVGGAIPTINLSGFKPGSIVLDGATLADIFMGTITQWNDKAIAKLNPGVKLPDTKITVVHRSDGSGTTWIWSNYLSKVSSTWAEKLGVNTAIAWPTGVGAKGNEGVASYVQRIPGAIGYNEYAYVIENKMNYVSMINKAGKSVKPSAKSFQAAAANADWVNSQDFYVVLTDQPGDESWPISGATFVLIHKQPDNADDVRAALKFFDWSFENGDDLAAALQYVPMPHSVVSVIEETWSKNMKDSSGKSLWPMK